MSVIQQCMRSHSTLPLTDLLWIHAINYQLHGALNRSSSDSFFAFPAFWPMVFHLLRRSRNENITEIKAGSFSCCLFTRLLPARKLCSLPLPHMTLLTGYFKWDKKYPWPFYVGGTPYPGFSASYIETCYCSMLPASSRLSIVGWVKKKLGRETTRRT